MPHRAAIGYNFALLIRAGERDAWEAAPEMLRQIGCKLLRRKTAPFIEDRDHGPVQIPGDRDLKLLGKEVEVFGFMPGDESADNGAPRPKFDARLNLGGGYRRPHDVQIRSGLALNTVAVRQSTLADGGVDIRRLAFAF